jgi:multiple sugar transport system permease protein
MTRSNGQTRNFLKGMAFLSPWLIGFFVFMLLPIGLSLYYSFCDYSILQPPVVCGWDNYRLLLFHDDLFWQVMRNTAYYAALVLPLGLVATLGAALLLNRKVPGQSIFRTIVFLPSLVPLVASAIVWMWIYNQKLGLLNAIIRMLYAPLNALLRLLHLPQQSPIQPPWIVDARWVIPALVLMSVWGMGNQVIIYLAGLQDVPRELYEAADLDGANSFRKLMHVTLPMISPVIFFNLVTMMIWVLQVYDAPFIISAGTGGPNHASYLMSMYLYDEGFFYLRMGYASAIAWMQLLIIVAMTAAAFWTSRRWVYYQGK